jgi:hypothetical protein
MSRDINRFNEVKEDIYNLPDIEYYSKNLKKIKFLNYYIFYNLNYINYEDIENDFNDFLSSKNPPIDFNTFLSNFNKLIV